MLLEGAIVVHDDAGRIRTVVDRDTGRAHPAAAGWRLVEPGSGAAEHLLLSYPDPEPAGGTMFARLDLATGELAYRGYVSARLSGCRSIEGGLVCLDSPGTLRLWRWHRR